MHDVSDQMLFAENLSLQRSNSKACQRGCPPCSRFGGQGKR